MMNKEHFDELKATGNLPSPRGSALRVMELCDRGDATLPEIIAVLNTDPATVGRVLKLANTSAYARSRPAVSITPEVLLTMGVKTLRQVVLTFSLVSHFRHGRCREFDYVAYWSRSLARAVACQFLGTEVRAAPATELFTCGLLARIGSLALASLYPDEYGALLQQIDEDELLRQERATFGITHTELSVTMLADWGLPKLFTEAVAYAESSSDVPFDPGSRTGRIHLSLQLAEVLATAMLGSESERAVALGSVLSEAEKLGLGPKRLAELASNIQLEWQGWGDLLQLAVDESHAITEEDMARFGDTAVDPSEHDRLDVLIVDDDPTIRMMLKKLLTAQGHTVSVATNGREGLLMMQDRRFDLLIVDWMMPEMDGISLVRMLRNTGVGEHLYMLMLTAHGDNSHMVEAFEAGVDDFMTKPIEPRILQARLSAGMRAVRIRRVLESERDRLHSDVRTLTEIQKEAMEAALTDPLTGLYNRRHANERLRELWAQALRDNRPLGVMMIDIDHFKQVNDTYGHAAGDAVLKQFSGILRKHSRVPDIVCRFGGEEFLVLLPDTSLAGVELLAERIRASCETTQFDADGHIVMLTASLGIAEKSASMTHYEKLLKAADRALYTAKHSGRNRVRAHADEPAESVRPPG